jgi:hypothetical protein
MSQLNILKLDRKKRAKKQSSVAYIQEGTNSQYRDNVEVVA